jgi:hypothetical protein
MNSSSEKLTFVKGKRPIFFYFFILNLAIIIVGIAKASSLHIQVIILLLINLVILYLLYLKKNPSFLKFEDYTLHIGYNYFFNEKIEICEYGKLSFSNDREFIGKGKTENTLVLYSKNNLQLEFKPLITGFTKEDINEIIQVLNNKKITQISKSLQK